MDNSKDVDEQKSDQETSIIPLEEAPSDISEEEIEDIIDIIDDDPIRAKTELRLIKRKISLSEWSAPLPRPSEFGEYGKYVHDAPERILCMTEREQGHRHHMDSITAEAAINHKNREILILEKDADWERKMQFWAFLMAFLLAGAFLCCATYLLIKGKEIGGFVSLASGIGILIAPFVYWKTKSSKT